ncbi:uncharacterized protein LOC131862125 [Cryptomeria japonica]|uniref:uncharacterized protein LOC131862125 n=1 Tax=Cryptomeria japonica TaxID=3369 RepID=UPI0027DA2F37|nr:uncharacterized protein LOC131862125 [Cryptomeria japonica]
METGLQQQLRLALEDIDNGQMENIKLKSELKQARERIISLQGNLSAIKAKRKELKIKQDKKNTFRYGSFIICLVFYFLGTIPSFGKTQRAFDRQVATQIAQILDRQGDKNSKANLWEFFKTFQEKMKNGSQIPKSIVEKYKDTICFMIDKDECMMEVVQPRTIWIMPMGYEVEETTLDAYAQHLLQALVDEKEEKFCTAKEKGLKVHQEQRKKELKQKRKEEREAQKVAQATPNVILVTSETSKQPEESSAEPASQTSVEPPKNKSKVTQQYMTSSSKEIESDTEIKEVPKNKDIFVRVVREKKEEQKPKPVKVTPRKPKITIVHKRKPKSDEKPKPEPKRRAGKKKMNTQDFIEHIVNDGNLDNICSFFDNFDEEDKKQVEEAILLYLDSFSRALIELEKVFPKELYDKLEVRKLHA